MQPVHVRQSFQSHTVTLRIHKIQSFAQQLDNWFYTLIQLYIFLFTNCNLWAIFTVCFQIFFKSPREVIKATCNSYAAKLTCLVYAVCMKHGQYAVCMKHEQCPAPSKVKEFYRRKAHYDYKDPKQSRSIMYWPFPIHQLDSYIYLQKRLKVIKCKWKHMFGKIHTTGII